MANRKPLKKPSKLARQKASPTSRYWRGKADHAWSDVIRQVGHCEICKREGIKGEIQGWTNIYAHHLIYKGNQNGARFRHDLSNGICLCAHCHKWHKDYAPHANPEGFREWLKINRSGQHKWIEENKQNRTYEPLNYKEQYEMLNEMLP